MIIRVDPSALTDTARPLRDVIEVTNQVQGVRLDLVTRLAGVGSEPVRRAAEQFMDAWATGLRALSERADMLAGVLDAAATGYTEAEERLRRQAAAGPDGGAA